MKDDIINYVRGCDICQKRRRGKERAEVDSATIINEPFAHIGIDVMGPLPRTLTGKRYIILAVDFFTKWIEGIAVEDTDVQTITKFIYSDIICRHGVPKQITSDRGTEFLNELVEEMERTYYIKYIRMTAYHQQGNRLKERQRKRQNEKIIEETLNIGDEVLLYRDTVEASWSVKLEPKWDGPYRVQDIKAQSIWLRRTDGTIILSAVHRNRLKKYHR